MGGVKQKLCAKGLHKLEDPNLIYKKDGARTCRRCSYDRHNKAKRKKKI